MRKKIPNFKSEKEEALFWDTHSPVEYQKELEEVKEPFVFSPTLLKKIAKRKLERKRTLTIRIGQQQIDLAKVLAKQKGLGYQTLMRMWIIEGIEHEFSADPRMRKLIRAA